ncbi:hypothetical protein WR25_07312 isoform N [Diploscapter pachys]|uniref:Uncharacterized protein n=1 Tax=Diploscapter pachys TaxID=2018661 RepID=A0A2A2LIN2_9BILA|nr:hypothetical protein WR25_07312 isoform N [Diploscapter pachys]
MSRSSMTRLKFGWNLGRRHFSTDRPATKVVLLHFGFPRTEFYAKDFLFKRALLYYNVPKRIQQFIPTTLMSNDTVRRCIERYGERESFEATVNGLSKEVETSLNRLVPEYGQISVSSLFYFDDLSGTFQDRVNSILRERSSHIVFMPLYSHFSNSLSGALIRLVAQQIEESTIPLSGSKDNSQRFLPNSDISFRVSLIHRWNSHPMISQFWRTNLEDKVKQFEGVLFVAPVVVEIFIKNTGFYFLSFQRGCGNTEYRHSVWANCERVMSDLGHPVPWKIGFYNSWDDWPIPIACEGYSCQSRSLIGKHPFEKRVAVVPITALLPDFDTFSRLPDLLQNTVIRIIRNKSSFDFTNLFLHNFIWSPLYT